jgi:hypothetical protein
LPIHSGSARQIKVVLFDDLRFVGQSSLLSQGA